MKNKKNQLLLLTIIITIILSVFYNVQAYQEDNIWRPKPGLSWQIQFADEIDLSIQANVYDIDLHGTNSEEVGDLVSYYHEQGAIVLCYISVGSYEDWRPDAKQFPSEILGNDYENWPGEKWLDIRKIDLLAPIMQARFDECAALGFDGIEADNIGLSGNDIGFPLTHEEEVTYAKWVADQAHLRGLAIGQKNGLSMVSDLVEFFDFAVIEDAFYYEEAELFLPYIKMNKAVFAVEYTDNWQSLDEICPLSTQLGFSTILKNRNLDAWIEKCPN